MKSGFDRIGHTVTVEAAHRQCLDKKPYASKNKARDAAARNKRIRPDSPVQRPYRCTLCHRYHLTSQVPYGLRRGETPAKAGQARKRA